MQRRRELSRDNGRLRPAFFTRATRTEDARSSELPRSPSPRGSACGQSVQLLSEIAEDGLGRRTKRSEVCRPRGVFRDGYLGEPVLLFPRKSNSLMLPSFPVHQAEGEPAVDPKTLVPSVEEHFVRFKVSKDGDRYSPWTSA